MTIYGILGIIYLPIRLVVLLFKAMQLNDELLIIDNVWEEVTLMFVSVNSVRLSARCIFMYRVISRKFVIA